ncbi:uncharacterized protein LJ206_015590 [Theristicus caerulescens]
MDGEEGVCPAPPPPVPAPARRRRRTGPGRGPRFVCAGPARASTGTPPPPPGSPRYGPARPPPAGRGAGGSAHGGEGPGVPPRCWARPRVPRYCLEPEPRGGGIGTPPARPRSRRCPGSGRHLCRGGARPPAAGGPGIHPPPAPPAPGVPHPRGGRGAPARLCPAGLGLLRARGGGWPPPVGPPGLPCLLCLHPRCWAPRAAGAGALPDSDPAAAGAGARREQLPIATPILPAPTRISQPHPGAVGLPGAGCPRDPLLPPRGACAVGLGDAAGTLGCSSLGRVGCWVRAVHAALRLGCLPCTHPPQPGCTLLSSRVPALGAGLGAPRAAQACSGPPPRQPRGSGEPRGPATSPRVPWASAVRGAGQEAAVSPGYISLPGIRCKGALPAKAAESSRNGSREGKRRGWPPPSPVLSPGRAASPRHPHPWG